MAGIEDVQRAINAEMARESMTRAQMAAQIGIDPGTLGDLLDGKRTPKAPTQGKIERHFDWPSGTVAEVLAGRAAVPTGGRGKAGGRDPATVQELDALLRVLAQQRDAALVEWAEAQAVLADLRWRIESMGQRQAVLTAEMKRLESLRPALPEAFSITIGSITLDGPVAEQTTVTSGPAVSVPMPEEPGRPTPQPDSAEDLAEN